ncbi:Phosphatidylethanolamine N-methyltransferase [Paramyrothecium foliicola]|nr:Phosphatidylethanolamine N-methyltransferase [Paramyrothecium foliicola]
MSTAADAHPATPGLRLRQSVKTSFDTEHDDVLTAASDSPTSPQSQHAKPDAASKQTIGRTPDGKNFLVPKTRDMVSGLFDPSEPKTLFDAFLIGVLAFHILVAYYLPSGWKQPVFAAIFLFWRASYNIGIGVLLRIQSHHRRLVAWAQRLHLFENPKSGKNPRPWLYSLLKREFSTKLSKDYDFDTAPIEYNTWLVFRRLVDLILMCDFFSYCLFAIICAHVPADENVLAGIGRWVLGIALILFNIWAKLDAHRVLTDYAWYWGDFFWLVNHDDQELTWDGVFELAPHPMYSIGYVGYYGISMMAASYPVLFISIAAHLSQLIFLAWVESPHIDKVYTVDKLYKKKRAARSGDDISVSEVTDVRTDGPVEPSIDSDSHTPDHCLVGFHNLDLFRVPDTVVIIIPLYVAALTFVTPSTPLWQALFVIHAFVWRLWYSLGLGIILDKQSQEKRWTRHFLKYGESVGEAWRQWKGMYHISMVMCNVSLVAACWKMYSPPEDWGKGLVLLMHVLGATLVGLQIWTAFSVYESLGEFGWFCGDFFLNRKGKLNYSSIYRFLNNPERVFGTAGVWGAALITWSRSIFILAVVTHVLTLWYISYVEKPHMRKIYGRSVRREAGVTKFIKRSLPPPVRDFQESVDKVLDDTTHFVEDFLETARPRLASGVKTIVRDTSALFNIGPARLTLSRIAPGQEGLNSKLYSLSVEGTMSKLMGDEGSRPGNDYATSGPAKTVKTKVYDYGTPLKVKWRAPANRSKNDWIGLYMVIDNRSREVTEASSHGRWSPTTVGTYDLTGDDCIATPEHLAAKIDPSEPDMVEGEVIFKGDRLYWSQGVFEFRYHHDRNHNVITVSEPFEIRIAKFDEEGLELDGGNAYEQAVEAALFPVIHGCLDQDPNIAPDDVDEPFGALLEWDGKYAKRIVYAIREMFGIDFTPGVVLADGNVRKLCWRICNAKKVLIAASLLTDRLWGGPRQPHLSDMDTQNSTVHDDGLFPALELCGSFGSDYNENMALERVDRYMSHRGSVALDVTMATKLVLMTRISIVKRRTPASLDQYRESSNEIRPQHTNRGSQER